MTGEDLLRYRITLNHRGLGGMNRAYLQVSILCVCLCVECGYGVMLRHVLICHVNEFLACVPPLVLPLQHVVE